ncbi:MAG: DUF3137 domain-containing protein [Pseudomonadota bacterium]
MSVAATISEKAVALDARQIAWLESLESDRLSALKSQRARAVLSAIGLLSALPAFFYFLDVHLQVSDPRVKYGIPALVAYAAYTFAMQPVRAFKLRVKSGLLSKIAAGFGLTYDTNPGDTGLEDRFRDIELVPYYSSFKSEDRFQGDFRGIPLDLVECHMEKMRFTGKRARRVTTFRGLLGRLAFKKRFRGRTLITNDQGLFNSFRFVGGNLGRVKLEDPVFEGVFEVYSTDQVEARYLLTPAFMERLVELSALFKHATVRVAFDAGDLLIAIDKREPSFEIASIAQPLADSPAIKELTQELLIFDAIVSTLNLTQTTRI